MLFQRQEMTAECDALLFVFSADCRHSFDEVLRCLDDSLVPRSDINQPRRLPTILVANKIDLVRRRVVSFEGMYKGVAARRCHGAVLTLRYPLLPYGYSYKVSCARPG